MDNMITHTLGCKVNFADVQSVVERLPQVACSHGTALVATCCITSESEKQSRKEVRRAVRQVGRDGLVFVTGCAARLRPEVFAGLAENIFVFTGEPDAVAAGIESKLEGRTSDSSPPVGAGSRRTRFFLKIQDGCANRCSYCVIPGIRGKPRSLAAAAVLKTAVKMVASGYPELVVSGINVGSWSDKGMNLASLIDRLAAIDGLKRLRLSSIEITGVSRELIDVIERRRIIGRHLHIPLQSGDDGVLAAMGRRYDTGKFSQVVELLKSRLPDINLTTDVIVGFPAESEVAFGNTLGFAGAAGFTKIHVFSYSSRPGTAAASMDDRVPGVEKRDRNRIMRELSDRLQIAHNQRKVGLATEILLESELEPRLHGGYSSDYTRYTVRGGDSGAMVKVIGMEATRTGIRGTVINDES